jgi:hypothetical protein
MDPEEPNHHSTIVSFSLMLHYPKIPASRHAPAGRCVAFEKCDGTNLHWDWDRELGSRR